MRAPYREIGSNTVKTKRGKAGRREAMATDETILSLGSKA